MGLDAVGFQYVGVDGALSQEVDALQLGGFLVKDLYELAADYLALLLGVGHAGQQVQEAVGGVHVDEVGVHLVAEYLDYLLAFALAHEAVVDVDAVQLLAYGLYEQRGDHGGVHAAGQGQQYLPVAYLGADGLHLLVDKGVRQGGGGYALHGFGTDVRIHCQFPP